LTSIFFAGELHHEDEALLRPSAGLDDLHPGVQREGEHLEDERPQSSAAPD